MFKSVCQQGGSVWQTVYKTVPAVSETQESYWDIAFIGIPIPVKRTRTTKTVRYNHYRRVYRCNGTVSDWELVDTSQASDYDGGTVTKAFGLFEWSAQNQQLAAAIAPTMITAKVKISPRVKNKGASQPQLTPQETVKPVEAVTEDGGVGKPTRTTDQQNPSLREYDVADTIVVPYNEGLDTAHADADPEQLWVSQPIMGWADAVEDGTTFIPYHSRNSGKVYLLKEDSIIPRDDLPPEVFSGLSAIPQYVKITEIRLAPRSEQLQPNEFSGELVNMRVIFEEGDGPRPE